MLWDLIRTQELLDSRNRLKVKSEPTSFYPLETIGKEVYQWRTLLRAVMRNPNFFHLAANPWGYQLYSHQPSFWASLPSGYNLPSQDFGSFLVVTNLRSPDGSSAFPHRSSRPADGGDWWSVWVFFSWVFGVFVRQKRWGYCISYLSLLLKCLCNYNCLKHMIEIVIDIFWWIFTNCSEDPENVSANRKNTIFPFLKLFSMFPILYAFDESVGSGQYEDVNIWIHVYQNFNSKLSFFSWEDVFFSTFFGDRCINI